MRNEHEKSPTRNTTKNSSPLSQHIGDQRAGERSSSTKATPSEQKDQPLTKDQEDRESIDNTPHTSPNTFPRPPIAHRRQGQRFIGRALACSGLAGQNVGCEGVRDSAIGDFTCLDGISGFSAVFSPLLSTCHSVEGDRSSEAEMDCRIGKANGSFDSSPPGRIMRKKRFLVLWLKNVHNFLHQLSRLA